MSPSERAAVEQAPNAKPRAGEHTEGPWRVHVDEIFGADGWQVHRFNGYEPLDQANARRIVACVNFLQGIPTEQLERGPSGVQTEFEQLKTLNGKLMEAAQKMVAFADTHWTHNGQAAWKVIDGLRDLLAKHGR